MIETPTVPPIERENCAALVAAPMWRLGTTFCTTSARFWISRPSPRPETTIATVANTRVEPASSMLSSANPAPITIGPDTSAHR